MAVSENKLRFFKGISVQSVITITMGLLEVVVFAVMSRLLSKEDFGYYAVLTGVVTISTCITEAGLGAAIIQKKDAPAKFISTAFSLSWGMGAVGTSVIFLFAPLIAKMTSDSSIILPLRIMSVNVFLACISSVRRCILIKTLQFKRVGKYNIISYSISSILGIVMAFYGFGLYSVVYISVSNLILFNILLYFKRDCVPKFGFDFSHAKDIVSFGGWLTASVIVNNFTQQIDRLFLAKWLSPVALGSYNRPAGFVANVTSKINGIFDTVLFPTLSKIQDDHEKVKKIFLQAVQLLNSFSVVLFALFFFNAELVVTIFFGKEWDDLVPILRIISFYAIFNIDSRLVDCYFRSLNFVKLGFELRFISAVMTFVALFVGAKFDIIGVAIALILANIMTVVLKVSALSLKINIPLSKVFMSILVAFRPLISLSILGIPFLLISIKDVFYQVLFFVAFCAVILLEFLFAPKLIGSKYEQMVYPLIKKKMTSLRNVWN